MMGLLLRLIRVVPVLAALVFLWPHAQPYLHGLHVPPLPGIDALARTRQTGPSVTLGPVSKRRGCHVDGPRPDRACTRGRGFAT
jgi:hypothetical protein